MRYKGLLYIFLFCCLLSCNKHFNGEEAQSPIAILGYGASGQSPSGNYVINRTEWDRTSNTFSFLVVPREFMDSPTNIDALYRSVIFGELVQKASPVEAFAYERINERLSPLKQQYLKYREEWVQSTGKDVRGINGFVSSFIHAYVCGVPVITADDILFGQPQGTDLSAWFRFRDNNIVSIVGTEYKMQEKGDIYETSQTAAEYFTMERMMPQVLYVCIDMPEEVTYTGRLVGDDVVKVTISIPVRFEKYWEWCKELYSNPEAKEQFVESTIRIELHFIRNSSI